MKHSGRKNTRSLDAQCKRIFDETIRLAREVGDFEAQAYFNQQTETWPIFAVCELGAEIRRARDIPQK